MTVEQGRAVPVTPVLSTVLRRAAVRATMAASIRNSQPWQLVLHPDRLVVRADRRRRLPVFDPTGRQLHVSCGAALLNARVAMAAACLGQQVSCGPGADGSVDPDDLAVLRAAPDTADPDFALGNLDWAVPRRRSSWGPFTAPADPAALAVLVAAARAEGGDLVPVDPDAAARSARLAARVLDAEPAYLNELRAWRTVDPGRLDGLTCGSRPGVGPAIAGRSWLPDVLDWRLSSCLVLSTPADSPSAWLRAGEALQRVLLTATALDLSVHLLSLPVEVPAARQMLVAAAGCPGHPQLVLRVGSAEPAPASARRRLVDVIHTVGDAA